VARRADRESGVEVVFLSALASPQGQYTHFFAHVAVVVEWSDASDTSFVAEGTGLRSRDWIGVQEAAARTC